MGVGARLRPLARGRLGQERRQVWAGLRGPRVVREDRGWDRAPCQLLPAPESLLTSLGSHRFQGPQDHDIPTGQMDKVLGLGSCNRTLTFPFTECWPLVQGHSLGWVQNRGCPVHQRS